MAAAPGWYDAGVPGRLRWWDGVQWTGHEVDAVAAVQPYAGVPAQEAQSYSGVPTQPAQPYAGVPAQPYAVVPPQQPWQPAYGATASQSQPIHYQAPHYQAPTGPPMGWYPTPAGPLRWWDGSKWTGLRVKNGVPGTDWATSEQPGAAWAVGSIFAVLALLQFALGLLTPGPFFSGGGMLVLAVLWFLIAAQSSAVRRIPAPVGDAVVIDAVLPLPGAAEGPGAGWYPVAPRTSRWWTGVRWSQYLGTAFGVRPTFHGARSWRTFKVMLWSLLGFGVLVVVVGIALTVAGNSSPSPDPVSLPVVIGVCLVVGGAILALVAGLMFAVSGRTRRLLFPPDHAPAGPPLG